jgi:hypothetical protein
MSALYRRTTMKKPSKSANKQTSKPVSNDAKFIPAMPGKPIKGPSGKMATQSK